MSESRIIKKYKIIEPHFNTDTYITCTTPSGAAKKVYSRYIRKKESDKSSQKHYTVCIENDSNYKHKFFVYDVHEVPKNDIVTRGKKDIPYTYTVMVKSKNIHKKSDSLVRKLKSKHRSNTKIKSSKSKSSKSKSSKSNSKSKKKTFVWFRPIKK